MPKIFEYLGIIIRFYSNEHDPIHVHAIYQDAEVKISFFFKEGRLYRTTYKVEKGKFPPSKMKALKKFVSIYNLKIVHRWNEYFIFKVSPKFEKITKKLSNEDRYN